MDDRILLIRTGGTIDAESYEDPKNPPKYVSTLPADKSLIMDTVSGLPNSEKVDGYDWGKWVENRFVKDSQLFTHEDIKALANIIRDDEDHKCFIFTHGTDAMVKNAAILQHELEGSGKKVAFVGSMVPLSMKDKHKVDGIRSLSFAIENLAQQPDGVYVVGRSVDNPSEVEFFNPQDVTKNHVESLARLKFTVERNR